MKVHNYGSDYARNREQRLAEKAKVETIEQPIIPEPKTVNNVGNQTDGGGEEEIDAISSEKEEAEKEASKKGKRKKETRSKGYQSENDSQI